MMEEARPAGEAGSGRTVFQVDLAPFQGPLDALLGMVESGKIDLASVPLGQVAAQVLAWVREQEGALDLASVGQDLVATATLVRRKVKALLPADPEDDALEDEEDEGVDPEEELARRLEEYRVFQRVAEELEVLRAVRSQSFARATPTEGMEAASRTAHHDSDVGDVPVAAARDDIPAAPQVDAPALARAFRELLQRRAPATEIHGMPARTDFSVAQGIDLILERVRSSGGRTSFTSLFRPGDGRTVWIVVFLSLLELMRRGRVNVYQDDAFSPIWVEGSQT